MSTTTTGTEERILAAVGQLQQATAAAIAKKSGMAYSTTTARLRTMHAAGQVERSHGEHGRTYWHTPTGGQQDPPADQPDAPPDAADPPPAARGHTRAGNTTATTRRSPRSGNTGRAAGSNKKGTGEAGKKKPGAAVTTEPATAPAAPADRGRKQPATADAVAGAAGGRVRRAKGALRAQVLAVLQDHPDHPFKVSQICRQLPGASAGAIANALDKLTADGNARQVADKPATYQAE